MLGRILTIISILTIACIRVCGETGKVMTVAGPIAAGELGKTLAHEHILVDFVGAEETGYHRWSRSKVVRKTLPHLEDLKAMGYDSLFECTPAYLGRDPVLLSILTSLSGINLITNTGFYGARGNQFIPKEMLAASPDELAAIWIREFEFGIEKTGIRPGFIKIGVDRDESLSEFHRKLVRAAARTHLATGLAIACHTGPTLAVFEIAEVLQEEGTPLDAFIWVHATRDISENHLKAARLGMWISIDNLRESAQLLRSNVERLKSLKAAGLLDRVLVSQDAGWYRPLEKNGGNFFPYRFVEMNLIPELRRNGFSESDIDQLMIANPRKAFALHSRD